MTRQGRSENRRLATWAAMLAVVVVVTGCGRLMAMVHGGPARPAESEFGLGPRASTAGLYRVTLEPVEPLATRKLQKVNVRIIDASGQPVDSAEMTVDGGMPQHGHGLPTRPRVSRALGDGRYEIDGVRFNMGGWWEFKLGIRAATGADSVTFNLQL